MFFLKNLTFKIVDWWYGDREQNEMKMKSKVESFALKFK